MGNETVVKNPLGNAPVGSLMVRFATPSIVAMLVGALYNIVDQLFIGHAVGALGNAATNVAFPMTISCIALALMFGIGNAFDSFVSAVAYAYFLKKNKYNILRVE